MSDKANAPQEQRQENLVISGETATVLRDVIGEFNRIYSELRHRCMVLLAETGHKDMREGPYRLIEFFYRGLSPDRMGQDWRPEEHGLYGAKMATIVNDIMDEMDSRFGNIMGWVAEAMLSGKGENMSHILRFHIDNYGKNFSEDLSILERKWRQNEPLTAYFPKASSPAMRAPIEIKSDAPKEAPQTYLEQEEAIARELMEMGVRPTLSRKVTLFVVRTSSAPLTCHEIHASISEKFGKETITKPYTLAILQQLTRLGLITQPTGQGGITTYAACPSPESSPQSEAGGTSA